MRPQEYTGRRAVAGALRAIADGIATGQVEIDGTGQWCDREVRLVVHADRTEQGHIDTVVLHLGLRPRVLDGAAVHRELAHPGG